MIADGRISYLLSRAKDGLAGDTDVLRQLARGVPELVDEIRLLQERAKAVEELVSDPFESGEDVEAWRVMEALRGPAPVEASTSETALWAKYFDNEQNKAYGLHVPPVGFRSMDRMLALRCNWCVYMVGGWVHVGWHEKQTPEVTERMLEERKEKLGRGV